MNTLTVNLNERSYPIFIGQDLLGSGSLNSFVTGNEVLIVTNETIAPLYLEQVKNSFKDKQCDVCILPDGEQFKNLEYFEKIIAHLLEANHHRTTTLVALGGGVVGDMTGFAAASYMRGVNFIQIPTSLLAQVDSSVGGKTGINHPLGKNMIGAFHQPKAVLIDIDTLKTLPDEQFRAGMAEVIKHGLIADAAYFEFLFENADAILAKDAAVLTQVIEGSCQIKANVVSQDERESGIRAILNFGHTIGHAIETAMNYQMLHGDAVFIGMRYALDLSVKHAGLSVESRNKALTLFSKFSAPIDMPSPLDIDTILSNMMRDKKFASSIKFILLTEIGKAVINTGLVQDDIHDVLCV